MAVTLNANSSTGFIATSDTSGVLQLQTGGTTAVTVDASQNVGIGTSSPSRKFVVSNAGAQGFEFGAGTGSGSGNELLNYNRSTSLYVGSYNYASLYNFYAGTAGNTLAISVDTSGNVSIPKGVGGTPTFSAYLASSGGSIASSTFTKCTFDTELWDTNNNFASSRFTPTVAGYYQINAAFQIASAAPGFISIYVNGNGYKRGAWNTAAFQDMAVSGLVYCNGSTDYVEIYIYQTLGSAVTPQGGAAISWFDACLVRGA